MVKLEKSSYMKRNLILIALLIVLLVGTTVLYHSIFGTSLTGGIFLTAYDIEYTTVNEDGVEFTTFDFSRSIEKGESIDIEFEMTNRGNHEKEGEFFVKIFNIDGEMLYRYPTEPLRIEPNQSEKRQVTHSPHDKGTYIINVRGSVNGETISSAKYLFVEEKPEEPETITRFRRVIKWIDPSDPPESPEEPEEGWKIEIPENYTISEKEGGTVPVRVENTGETILRNIMLEHQTQESFDIDVTPVVIFDIIPNASQTFLLNIETVKRNISEETLTLRIESETLSTQWKDIELEVTPDLTLEQLEEKAEMLENLLIDAKSEKEILRNIYNLDTVGITSKLNESFAKINQSREYIARGDVENSSTILKNVEADTDRIYRELFRTKHDAIDIKDPLFEPSHIFVLIIIIIFIIVVLNYYYIIKKSDKRPKLLRKGIY